VVAAPEAEGGSPDANANARPNDDDGDGGVEGLATATLAFSDDSELFHHSSDSRRSSSSSERVRCKERTAPGRCDREELELTDVDEDGKKEEKEGNINEFAAWLGLLAAPAAVGARAT